MTSDKELSLYLARAFVLRSVIASPKKLLYIAWVRSRLEYASWVWSPHTKRNINNLEQVQRRATRFILGRDYSEYERLSKLNKKEELRP